MTAVLPPSNASAHPAHPRQVRPPLGSQAQPFARSIGIDIARFLAIVGMMASHLVAAGAGLAQPGSFAASAADVATLTTSGIAAPLFAVLGGVSAVFASRRLLREGRTGAAIGALALRGVILIVIGLLLGLIVSPVVVVLAYYGVALILLAPLIRVRGPFLATLAAIIALGTGPLNALARNSLGVVNEGGSLTFEALFVQPIESLRGLLLTGEYPAVTWLAYLIIGVLIGRLLTAASAPRALRRTSAWLAGAGAAAAALAQLVSSWALANLATLGFVPLEGVDPEFFRVALVSPALGAPFSPDLWAQLIATPHSGSPVDLIRTVGIACAVIGLLVLLCDGIRGGRPPGRLLDVPRAAGAAPLTVYALHIIVTGTLLEPFMTAPELLADVPWWVIGPGAFAVQLAGVLALGAVLSATRLRGPLEALTSRTVELVVRRRA